METVSAKWGGPPGPHRTPPSGSAFRPSVLTIGKFDGVHAGHAHLLRQVIALAAQHGLAPSVLTFDPHPVCVLAPERAPKPLATVEERCTRMRELGIEQIFVLPFTREIARLSPEEFVAQYLQQVMRTRFVLVGRDFRFGYRQAGDPAMLADLGSRYGFETRLVDPVKWHGLVISTSEVRTRIEAGEVSVAGRLLERPYALSGDVVPGPGVGSKPRPFRRLTSARRLKFCRATAFILLERTI